MSTSAEPLTLLTKSHLPVHLPPSVEERAAFFASHPDRETWVRRVRDWGGFRRADYRRLYPDVKWPGMVLHQHYYRYGLLEDRVPNAQVLLDSYTRSRHMALKSPAPTIYHMVCENAPELHGRLPYMDPAERPVAQILKDWDGFDPTFYLSVYPDVAQAGLDPFEHFCVSGLYECRDPNEEMNVRAYCLANEDKDFSVAPAVLWMIRGQYDGEFEKI